MSCSSCGVAPETAPRSLTHRERARIGAVVAVEVGQVGARRIVRDQPARGVRALGAEEGRGAGDHVHALRVLRDHAARRRAVERLGRADAGVEGDGVVVARLGAVGDGVGAVRRIVAGGAAHGGEAVGLVALVRPDGQHHVAPAVGEARRRVQEVVTGTVRQAEGAGQPRDVQGGDVVAERVLGPHRDLQVLDRLEVDLDGAARRSRTIARARHPRAREAR